MGKQGRKRMGTYLKKKTEAEKKTDLILKLQIALGALLDAEIMLKQAIEDYKNEKHTD